ncbi:uncharacterized protein MONOS_2166 [Monocercomonoides exilis]|uniref:uncharacterized protein n=1 Tax=Monocercomonoides exilis TaxID=2049356 RepID=UPI003559386C|nr:hypothetical protein MONOS_2166 [Monocercomonoides exilis]|eukprot:MONOS_2166.1-p1 / transcript=MONOS_2166.1 / gene=MONOS_2166 / organism=Monocercomonoides_exilis_PA203 / gene_product=unspecified product / transcript_product=unspecified product / location=Mono_scaffold00043:23817-27240(-) / protein_length=1115 / sequence_SO=supercontig / SO=protein_coding / is_pseudo=false
MSQPFIPKRPSAPPPPIPSKLVALTKLKVKILPPPPSKLKQPQCQQSPTQQQVQKLEPKQNTGLTTTIKTEEEENVPLSKVDSNQMPTALYVKKKLQAAAEVPRFHPPIIFTKLNQIDLAELSWMFPARNRSQFISLIRQKHLRFKQESSAQFKAKNMLSFSYEERMAISVETLIIASEFLNSIPLKLQRIGKQLIQEHFLKREGSDKKNIITILPLEADVSLAEDTTKQKNLSQWCLPSRSRALCRCDASLEFPGECNCLWDPRLRGEYPADNLTNRSKRQTIAIFHPVSVSLGLGALQAPEQSTSTAQSNSTQLLPQTPSSSSQPSSPESSSVSSLKSDSPFAAVVASTSAASLPLAQTPLETPLSAPSPAASALSLATAEVTSPSPLPFAEVLSSASNDSLDAKTAQQNSKVHRPSKSVMGRFGRERSSSSLIPRAITSDSSNPSPSSLSIQSSAEETSASAQGQRLSSEQNAQSIFLSPIVNKSLLFSLHWRVLMLFSAFLDITSDSASPSSSMPSSLKFPSSLRLACSQSVQFSSEAEFRIWERRQLRFILWGVCVACTKELLNCKRTKQKAGEGVREDIHWAIPNELSEAALNDFFSLKQSASGDFAKVTVLTTEQLILKLERMMLTLTKAVPLSTTYDSADSSHSAESAHLNGYQSVVVQISRLLFGIAAGSVEAQQRQKEHLRNYLSDSALNNEREEKGNIDSSNEKSGKEVSENGMSTYRLSSSVCIHRGEQSSIKESKLTTIGSNFCLLPINWQYLSIPAECVLGMAQTLLSCAFVRKTQEEEEEEERKRNQMEKWQTWSGALLRRDEENESLQKEDDALADTQTRVWKKIKEEEKQIVSEEEEDARMVRLGGGKSEKSSPGARCDEVLGAFQLVPDWRDLLELVKYGLIVPLGIHKMAADICLLTEAVRRMTHPFTLASLPAHLRRELSLTSSQSAEQAPKYDSDESGLFTALSAKMRQDVTLSEAYKLIYSMEKVLGELAGNAAEIAEYVSNDALELQMELEELTNQDITNKKCDIYSTENKSLKWNEKERKRNHLQKLNLLLRPMLNECLCWMGAFLSDYLTHFACFPSLFPVFVEIYANIQAASDIFDAVDDAKSESSAT